MSVKVAVRVRPFNSRERDMNAKMCIAMDKKSGQTIITHPETGEEKKFTFDFSYWSFDGCEQDEKGTYVATGDRYASQRMVYEDLGAAVLSNAYEGYNSTLFAYGQTGSGKSYSMVGDKGKRPGEIGPNAGIVPIICTELFLLIDKETRTEGDNPVNFQVTITMLEIYNEQVKDLLNPSNAPSGGLKIREHKTLGNYVEGLTEIPVSSYAEIEAIQKRGTRNRTVGATKMNNTSSRAHTVVGISFTKIERLQGLEAKMTAKMNLVDLAGSERADSTGAVGDRLKEGCQINQSLTMLGNVIKALAQKAEAKEGSRPVFIPYRNSVLTRILKEALGGNSKTVMIAALSPADVNYDETLSTLRYADRAKSIKNVVFKVENPTDALIKQLTAENNRLKLELGDGPSLQVAKAKEDAMRANQKMLEEMNKSWEQKLAEAQALFAVQEKERASESELPCLINLHEDSALSECIIYPFKPGITRIGKKGDVSLTGLNVKNFHCDVESDAKGVKLTPLKGAKTFVNGDLVTVPTDLHHHDRVIIGANFVFRYANPLEANSGKVKTKRTPTYESAVLEKQTRQGERATTLAESKAKAAEQEQKLRQDLEDRLKAMESKLLEEQKASQAKLEQQRLELAAAGGSSAEQLTQQLRAEAEAKVRREILEAKMAEERKAEEAKLERERLRLRQTRAVEDELETLTPHVNSANDLAEELNKPVHFQPKLSVGGNNEDNPIPSNSSAGSGGDLMAHVKVMVKVTNKLTGSIVTWDVEKFENRYHLMNEMYAEANSGSLDAQNVSKLIDPFWDPPQPEELGRAYGYLFPLAHLFDIAEPDSGVFKVIDNKGKQNGTLYTEIIPLTTAGEEIEDGVDDPLELLGRSYNFRISIQKAVGLNNELACNVFVRFKFHDKAGLTPQASGLNANPTWNYDTIATVNDITEPFIEYLKTGSCVFQVMGYSKGAMKDLALYNKLLQQDAKERAIAEAEQQQLQQQSSNVASGSVIEVLCDRCADVQASWSCQDCQQNYCENCNNLLHKAAKRKTHIRVLLNHNGGGGKGEVKQAPLLSSGSNGVSEVLCQRCEEIPASVQCTQCPEGMNLYCPACEALMHKAKKKQTHIRIVLGGSSEAPPESKSEAVICDFCEEQNAEVKCVECEKSLCAHCEALLHKAKRKKTHQRIRL